MQTFTGWQYLLIDVANAYGLEKEVFEKRLAWANDNLAQLESMADDADTKPLFVKATMAIRKAQAGMPTGHVVGLDAVCSGMQIMSVVTGCTAGARATGLIDTGIRPDAYTAVTDAMNQILPGGVSVSRDNAKRATMTSLYGSKKVPKDLFGEGTPELDAFYQAMTEVAPGAWGLLQDLMNSWQPYSLAHSWKLPDGFDARVKVMQKIECRIEVDELDHSTFTYQYYENAGAEKGISLAANVVHSLDGYVLRSVHRRCNYDRSMVEDINSLLSIINTTRALSSSTESHPLEHEKLSYHVALWQVTGMVDAAILPHITTENALQLPHELLKALLKLTDSMLAYQPFEVITIHDEFKCGPNHMNQLRQVYLDVMAELADSNVLEFILSTIHGKPVRYHKLSTNLSQQIRQANYALC